MASVIELSHVTKSYGSARGIDDVTLSVEAGTVFGFLGPNGAGKTTTINMLVNLIRPTGGMVSIFGLDCHKEGVNIRRRIGFLAGDFALDERLTGWQQLTYFDNLRGSGRGSRIRELAKRLSSDLDRPIKMLSRGNRQKIGLVSALMHDPELLIFDEPTSGLDPLIQAEFNKIVLEYKAASKTVFISSHMLSEVQEICDEVAFIRDGRLIATENMANLASRSPKHLRVASSDKKLRQALQKIQGVTMLPGKNSVVECTYSGDINTMLNVLSRYKLSDVTITEADLETIFMNYYSKEAYV